jgi:hypothetical protein
MPLMSLKFRPGINRDLTSFSNQNGWRDGDKIRFRLGYPEKLGGWEKYSGSTYLGSARALHNWISLDGSNYLGVGTHLKYYIEEGTLLNDITPIRQTTGAGDVTFSATDGSSVITVTDVDHECQSGDFVTFSGAASLGGTVTDTILNQEYEIDTVIDANNYTIIVSVTANSSDTGNGGASTVGVYQINTGLDTTVGGTGWGAGLYYGRTTTALQTALNEASGINSVVTTFTVDNATGIVASDVVLIDNELMLVSSVVSNDLTVTRGYAGTGSAANVQPSGSVGAATSHSDNTAVYLVTGNANTNSNFSGWGDAASGGLTTTTQIRLWSQDNFGEDLLINPRDSNIYYWDRTDGLITRAVELSTESGTKSSVPQVCKQILVSDRDRHVIAFGCDGLGATNSDPQGDGIQDPLLIRFSTQENFLEWFPSSTNSAGDLRLGSGSEFVKAIETKREILVWTDTALTSMRFIGPPFTFGLQQLASNITIAGPNAAAATEDFVFWMGIDNFYVHAGQTAQVPCTVKDYVFNDFNIEQRTRVFAGVNSEFSEVFWFYPSSSSDENDRYVVYNYAEKVWYYGNLSRTAWLDRGTRAYPIGVTGGYIYNHELGYDDDGSAMDSFIESASIGIGDGYQFSYVRKVIPDLTFDGSTGLTTPEATFTLKARNNPGADFNSTESGTAIRTQSSPVETYTSQLDLRVRGRSFAIRVESDALGSKWKLGTTRVDIRPDGRR